MKNIIGLKVRVANNYRLKVMLPNDEYTICEYNQGKVFNNGGVELKTTPASIGIKVDCGTHMFYGDDISCLSIIKEV